MDAIALKLDLHWPGMILWTMLGNKSKCGLGPGPAFSGIRLSVIEFLSESLHIQASMVPG